VTDRPATRRLFIALPLPEPARSAVVEIVDRVRTDIGEGSGVRWVRTDGLHLTLRFLGHAGADRITAVEAVVADVAASTGPFDIVLEGAGAFPSPGRPRVLWLGITTGAERVGELAGSLGRGLAAIGWPPEDRPYRAHLTLARTDGAPGGRATATRLAEVATGVRIAFTATQLDLMESHTGRGPARYTTLHPAALAGQALDPYAQRSESEEG
jgi:2'-5' RNA ligase